MPKTKTSKASKASAFDYEQYYNERVAEIYAQALAATRGIVWNRLTVAINPVDGAAFVQADAESPDGWWTQPPHPYVYAVTSAHSYPQWASLLWHGLRQSPIFAGVKR